MDFKQISNSPIMWLVCLPLVFVVLAQVYTIYKKAVGASDLVGLTKEERKSAFKVGAITAFGPSFSAFIIIISMAAVMGSPITWQRVSVIASAETELRAAQYVAEVLGAQLGDPSFTMQMYDAALWVMAINGCGWMLFCLLFTDKMGKITSKITGGNSAVLAAFALSAMIATIVYISSNYIKPDWSKLVTCAAAALGYFLLSFVGKKYPKFGQWTFGVALLFGMFVGTLYSTFVLGA